MFDVLEPNFKFGIHLVFESRFGKELVPKRHLPCLVMSQVPFITNWAAFLEAAKPSGSKSDSFTPKLTHLLRVPFSSS